MKGSALTLWTLSVYRSCVVQYKTWENNVSDFWSYRSFFCLRFFREKPCFFSFFDCFFLSLDIFLFYCWDCSYLLKCCFIFVFLMRFICFCIVNISFMMQFVSQGIVGIQMHEIQKLVERARNNKKIMMKVFILLIFYLDVSCCSPYFHCFIFFFPNRTHRFARQCHNFIKISIFDVKGQNLSLCSTVLFTLPSHHHFRQSHSFFFFFCIIS